MKRLKVLIACERFGAVRDAFLARGHDAWSCDILPSATPGPHIVNDVRNVLDWGWDMMIGHPECRYLSYAGLRWEKRDPNRIKKSREAFNFFMLLWNAPIPNIALENPHGYVWRWFRTPDQIIQPWQFDEPATKATGLWLKQLPPLMATVVCANPFVNWTKKGKFVHSSSNRSRTFPGVASAMAQQWG